MNGSPTLLVDGIDPFAGPGQLASVSCRLFRDSQRPDRSRPFSAPAPRGHQAPGQRRGRYRRRRLAGCARARRPRTGSARRTRTQGGTPSCAALLRGHRQGAGSQSRSTDAAQSLRRSQILEELAEGDYLDLDHAGQIMAAYPFSATATPHTVHITGGASAYSMCAIDALGAAEMLGTSVQIKSADPSTGEPISVSVDGTSAVWDPDTP